MVVGDPPFFDEKLDTLYENIKSGKLRYPSYLSIEVKSLISKLLERDITKRIGVKDFNDIKSHDFFKKMDWKMLLSRKITPPSEMFLNDQDVLPYHEV
jgi:serum/glucocorticoid-regulated kinase 2